MAEGDEKALVAQILSSYLSHNTVAPGDLQTVIETVRKGILGAGGGISEPVSETTEKPQPAVPIKKSITSDALTCLCCGKKFKSLKRHLSADHKLTPEQYREMFDLKSDYPMVAPAYAEARSKLALSLGLGRKPKAAAPEPVKTETVSAPAPKKTTVPAAASPKGAAAKKGASSSKKKEATMNAESSDVITGDAVETETERLEPMF